MAEALTGFRNSVCGVLLFINILFLVFTITMKLKSDGLEKARVTLPMAFLSFGHETFEEWQLDQLPFYADKEGLFWRFCFYLIYKKNL